MFTDEKDLDIYKYEKLYNIIQKDNFVSFSVLTILYFTKYCNYLNILMYKQMHNF